MIQLNILSGKMAGATWSARRFPVRIGRDANADLRLEEDGVWDQHLLLDFLPSEGFVLLAQADALPSVNGQPVERTLLHNGDAIELGALKLRFWLSETRQRGLRWRESLTWTAITLVSLGQIALIYWLVR